MEAEKVAKQMADEKQDYNGKQNNGLSVLFSGLLMLISARRDACNVWLKTKSFLGTVWMVNSGIMLLCSTNYSTNKKEEKTCQKTAAVKESFFPSKMRNL